MVVVVVVVDDVFVAAVVVAVVVVAAVAAAVVDVVYVVVVVVVVVMDAVELVGLPFLGVVVRPDLQMEPSAGRCCLTSVLVEVPYLQWEIR